MSDKKMGPTCANTSDPKIHSVSCLNESVVDDQDNVNSSISNDRLGEFPIEGFPEPIKRIALELADVYNVPVCLPAISCLAFLSGAMGKMYVVCDAYRNAKTYLNLYTILVVERGLGKGNIGDTLSKPILAVERELREQWSKDCRKARADLEIIQEKLKQSRRAAVKDVLEAREAMTGFHEQIEQIESFITSPPSLLIDDTTSEALSERLAANGENLISYSSEAGTLVKVALGKYTSAGDFDLLLHAYSGTAYKSDRMGRRSVQLENPRLTTLWMVQKSVLESLLEDKEAFERGLTARPLIVNTRARRTKDDGSEKVFTLADLWASLLEPLLSKRKQWNPGQEPEMIPCSGEAKEVFRQFHNESIELEEERFPGLGGECSRWRENAIKVAGILQWCQDRHRMIDEKTAEAACAVVRWCGLGYLQLLQEKRMDGLQKAIEKLEGLCQREGGEISIGKLQSNHGYRSEKLKHVRYLVQCFPYRLKIELRNGRTKPTEVLMLVDQEAAA